jgi:general secretion pathway protein C
MTKGDIMKYIIITITIALLAAGTTDIATADAGMQSSTGTLREVSFAYLQLKGTLFTESLNPLAIIEDTRNGQVIIYGLGDDVQGMKIARISRGEVVLGIKADEYVLSFPYGGVSQLHTREDMDGKWYNIVRQGNTITTDRATITGAISRVREIMKGLKAGPYSQGGKRSGIAIIGLNEEGILREIGIKQGDIIKTVNGLTLNSPYQIFNAYRRLKDRHELKIDIVRKGTPLTLTYRVEK